MRIAVVPDAAQQSAQFTAGNLDEYLPSIDDLATAQQRNPKAMLTKAQDGIPWPVFWQLGDPASTFQDIRVRRAFSMAIDRQAIGNVIFNGQVISTVFLPAYLGKWSVAVSDLDPATQQYYKYNPAEAKKLLEAAGATDLQLTFVYVVNGPRLVWDADLQEARRDDQQHAQRSRSQDESRLHRLQQRLYRFGQGQQSGLLRQEHDRLRWHVGLHRGGRVPVRLLGLEEHEQPRASGATRPWTR